MTVLRVLAIHISCCSHVSCLNAVCLTHSLWSRPPCVTIATRDHNVSSTPVCPFEFLWCLDWSHKMVHDVMLKGLLSIWIWWFESFNNLVITDISWWEFYDQICHETESKCSNQWNPHTVITSHSPLDFLSVKILKMLDNVHANAAPSVISLMW